MEHLTLFERQFIAKAAFDWYHQHGYNTELSFFHGMSEYRVTVYLADGEALPAFPFLDHPDITKRVNDSSRDVTIITFIIPYDRANG